MHATILKGIVGGFEFLVLQRKLKELARKAMKMCLRVLTESNKSRFESYSRQEQCIDHIPYYLSGLSRAHIFRQPFSKQLYTKMCQSVAYDFKPLLHDTPPTRLTHSIQPSNLTGDIYLALQCLVNLYPQISNLPYTLHSMVEPAFKLPGGCGQTNISQLMIQPFLLYCINHVLLKLKVKNRLL